MQLEIPQFMVQDDAGMFGGDELLVPLNETALLDGFTLAAKDAAVPFNLAVSGAVRVDISESGDVTPRCKQLTKPELEYFSAQLATKTTDDRINALLEMAATQLDGKIDFCRKKEIKDYVVRVAQQLPAAERNQLSLELLPSFVQCVRDKIDKLAKQHKRAAFNDKINQNAVVCRANYKLPQTIQPITAVTYIEKALYTGEYDDMNPEELSVIQAIDSKENVKWWHRIKDRKGFCINGFINHYPDFMVYTDKGNVVMVEYKGADRDGSDSQAKAELGRIWADNAGQRYKYFMVFLKDGDAVQGALKMDAFLNTIEKL
jgi:type III restriction enzyme